MKVMKCLWLSLLCTCLLFTGCEDHRSSQNWMVANGRIKVLCTTAMIGDLVKEVGGKKVDVCLLISNGLDPHSYQLVKGDDEKLTFAQLIFSNGLGLEHGPSLQNYLESSPKTVSVGEWIYFLFPDQILHYNGQPDPHIWMDVSIWAKSIPLIVTKLSELDPTHGLEYQNNGETLNQKLQDLHRKMMQITLSVPAENRYLVTSHDAFNYFTRAYLAEPGEVDWKSRFVAPEGLSPDSQLSCTEIQATLAHILAHHIQTLFPESNVNRNSLLKVVDAARLMGISLNVATTPLFGDAMGDEVESYFDMMEYNANAIASNLRRANDG